MARDKGTHCGKGHEFTRENTKEKKSGGRECRACANDRNRARLNSLPDDLRKLRRRQAYVRERERIGLPAKKSPLDYLKLTPTQSQARDNFDFAFDRLTAEERLTVKCHRNPGPYMDYDERTPPSPEEAFKLCGGCAVFEECDTLARALKPKTGVWAGRVWIDGKTEV